MNQIFLVLALLALTTARPEGMLSTLKVGQPCPNPINAYVVSSFTVVPFPPTRGSSPVSTSVGTFNQAETLKSISVNVLLNGRSIYQENIPQTGSYTAGQVGTFTYSQQVPAVAPKGSYTITGGLVNTAGAQISCWEVAFTLN